jgi:mannose-6-phosphate isomerase
MPIELARRLSHEKPWGVSDLRPWSPESGLNFKTGEIWYQRESESAPEPSLCLKLLFTGQPLSIQVHPDDTYAQTIGLPRGKTEAWYVVSAEPDARIGLGLTQRLTSAQLKEAAHTGTIADLVLWRGVLPGDSALVPARTVHAIGEGLVIAEIQQHTDATFRLFDHHRGRELHLEQGCMAADGEPAPGLFQQCRLSDARRLLATSPYFVFERLDLPPGSNWRLDTDCETWVLALDGGATAGDFALSVGTAIFAESDEVDLRVGVNGLVALVAYAKSSPLPYLLRRLSVNGENHSEDTQLEQVTASFARAITAYMTARPELNL